MCRKGAVVDQLCADEFPGGFVVPAGVADPVFVLCMGRSGSTLLRFLLDAHPELACPPETSMPALCGQLAVVWSLIEGAPLAAEAWRRAAAGAGCGDQGDPGHAG